MTIDPEWKPSRNENFVWREVEGEVYILGDNGLTLRVLNGSGSALWALCDGTRTVEALAAEIVERFDVDPDTARHDTGEFLDEVRAAGLLQAE